MGNCYLADLIVEDHIHTADTHSGLSEVGPIMVSFAPKVQCCYFCESSCFFYLSFNIDFYVSKIIHTCARNLPRKPIKKVSEKPWQN